MIVVDAGPLYAQADRDDKHHEMCREFLAAHPGPLIVPTLIIGEVTYLIELVACAERLGVTSIATLDRRHFSVVRPRHVESFELLP